MGDFGRATEAIRIIDLVALRVLAKNSDRWNFRLLQQNRVESGLHECTAPSPLRPKTDIETSDSLERRHEGRAFIQHGQNRVSGLGRKHQDDPINAGVTVAF